MKFEKTNRDRCLRALQLTQLEGLKEIDRICRKHNIQYSLGGGTCLGQLRHGGIIPWDDDIDVDMTVDNFERFVKVAPLEIDPNKFYLRCKQTDKTWLRTFSRLEIVSTEIGLSKWDKLHMHVGIFVDIFTWSYLPNNRFLRKIVSSNLFYLRCVENYKQFHNFAKKSKPLYRPMIYLCAKLIPFKIVEFIETRLRHCCRKKTNWMIDDAIINGNHGGFPAEGIDEYKDVSFEGLTVMNKTNAKNFMSISYGDNYYKWLPPTNRISHHKWTHVDFGIYEEKFDLPENYSDIMCINLTNDKVKQMQKVSFDMLEYLSKILNANKLTYYIADYNTICKGFDIEEEGSFWKKPLTICMPRNDYNKLSNKMINTKKYFLQNDITDSKYHYQFSRLRLKYTFIREFYVPLSIDENYENGFFINIVPLDITTNNLKKQKKHAKKIRYLNHFINLKWAKTNLQAFKNGNIKMKLKIIFVKFCSMNHLKKKLNKQLTKYKKGDYYVDSTGYLLNGQIFSKDLFGSGVLQKYNGYEFVFPENCVDFYKNLAPLDVKHYDYLRYIKKENKNFYNRFIDKRSFKKINKKYGACYLTYYDIDEYQLSVLNYDNDKNKFLSIDELIK